MPERSHAGSRADSRTAAEMDAKMRGSCLCGGLRYELTAPLQRVVHCHCAMCRKATGAAFRTRASVRTPEFRWTQGEALLGRHESSPGETRTFCTACGATLITLFRDHPELLGLALGTLDDDPRVRAVAHVHVASKAPWFEITDDLPQFAEGLPSDFEWPSDRTPNV
jgi:hypothetical protein